jgi:hypothetical protein
MTTREIQSYITMNKPLAIYLGRLEMEDMEREAREAGYFAPTSPEPDLNRMEYHGVPLYRVNAESHLGFGHNASDQATARK